jgi:hypothetical protein
VKIRKIPPLLTGFIHTALRVCDGVRFHNGSTCRFCGGSLSGYDERKKRFAILIEDNNPSPVQVIIKRSYCRKCGNTPTPVEPFYPGTRIGSPIVDLCRSLSEIMPHSRASRYMRKMGVSVDRWSVRNYALMPLPEVPSVEVCGMQIPVSIVALSSLAATPPLSGTYDMDDILLACKYPFITL